MPNQLNVQLLGGFALTLDGQPLTTFRSAKARGLLAYVAAQPDVFHSRSRLATLFWGGSSDAAAKTNLRIELSKLKKTLHDHPALEVTRAAVRFHSDRAAIDAHRFQQAVDAFLALPAENQTGESAHFEEQVALYQGDFLAGLNLERATEFDDWQMITREVLHEQMIQALEALQTRYAESGQWVALARIARRQLAVIPWAEDAHRSLMQALAAQGKVGEALAQFEICRRTLQEELGVDPSSETMRFARRLQEPTGSPGHQPGMESNQAEQTLPKHNLPLQLKRFVGRATDIERVEELVQHERLVTLLGIGGVGKSHLAQIVAQRVLHQFPHGVWFVPLANIEPAEGAMDQISLAIAAAMGLSLTMPQTPLDELVSHLRAGPTLLVLDNWDHLTEHAAGLLMPLFVNTPVHVLATSRLRLPLVNEIPVPIDGLPMPEAAALFVDRARRIASGFEAAPDAQGDATHSADVMRICELVGGLPLGVEIAASWVEHFTVAEIGQSIAQTPANFEAAPGQAHQLVQRHRGLSQLFEYSWRLLSPSQQQILARCALFRGGFDREAASQVTESSLGDLSILLNHSLIQRVSPGRYDLHPLIQEFAAVKLPKREEAHYGRLHSHHYLQKLVSVPRTVWGADLRPEFENLRGAWQRAVHNQDTQIIARTMVEFGDFMTQYGLVSDGNALFQEAVRQFEALREEKVQNPETHSETLALNELLAELLFQQWTFARAFQGLPDVYPIHYRILDLTTSPEKQIRSHLSLATHHGEVAEWEQADEHFRQVEQLAHSSADPRHYISAVESRIHINAVHFRGQYKEGVDQLLEMLALFESLPMPTREEDPDGRRRQEDVRLHSQLYQSLALVSTRYRDYASSIWAVGQHLDMLAREGMDHLRGSALLDLALAEQFAGLYEEAITHNMESLSAAQESGTMDDVGLLQANLCLTLRQVGRLEEALERGKEGAQLLGQLKLTRMEGQARNRVGHTLLVMQHWEEAYDAYNRALVTWEPLHHANRFEAMAGKAWCGWRLGKKEEAFALMADVRRFVEAEGLAGVVEPLFLLLNCAAVLREAGCLDEATEVVDIGLHWMKTVSERISEPVVRDAFLNRPDCRAIRSYQTAPLETELHPSSANWQ